MRIEMSMGTDLHPLLHPRRERISYVNPYGSVQLIFDNRATPEQLARAIMRPVRTKKGGK